MLNVLTRLSAELKKVEGRQPKVENQKWKEGNEIKEEFPACKIKDMHLFRDGRGMVEEDLADHLL